MKKLLRFIFIAGIAGSVWSANPPPNLITGGNMEEPYNTVDNLWAGVDGSNYLQVATWSGTIVEQDGGTRNVNFPPSVAVGDLNGDGLPDLVVADARGAFWYFKNTGTATQPKFNRGEIIPLWLHGARDLDWARHRTGVAACHKICLTDLNNDGVLSLMVGNFDGALFLLENTGSKSSPHFNEPEDVNKIVVPTYSGGKLWSNYFSPFYYDWFGRGKKDLIVGEGSYSANNIYFFTNNLSNQNPKFDEKNRVVMIRGMGKEHLTPQAYDWNGDGKPDIITGEREGTVSVYINNSPDGKTFSFEPPQVIKFGGSTKPVPQLSAPTVADLNGDGLPDLVFGIASGHIGVAYNKGTAKDPQFGSVVELKGEKSPFPKYGTSRTWGLDAPSRSLYEVLKVVSADPKDSIAYEPKFEVHPGATGNKAIKFEFVEPGTTTFTSLTPMLPNDSFYVLYYNGSLSLKPKTNYKVSFWQKGSGFSSARIELTAHEGFSDDREAWYTIPSRGEAEFSLGGSWSQVTRTVSFEKPKEEGVDQKSPVNFGFRIILDGGRGTFYLDDVSITEDKD